MLILPIANDVAYSRVCQIKYLECPGTQMPKCLSVQVPDCSKCSSALVSSECPSALCVPKCACAFLVLKCPLNAQVHEWSEVTHLNFRVPTECL